MVSASNCKDDLNWTWWRVKRYRHKYVTVTMAVMLMATVLLLLMLATDNTAGQTTETPIPETEWIIIILLSVILLGILVIIIIALCWYKRNSIRSTYNNFTNSHDEATGRPKEDAVIVDIDGKTTSQEPVGLPPTYLSGGYGTNGRSPLIQSRSEPDSVESGTAPRKRQQAHSPTSVVLDEQLVRPVESHPVRSDAARDRTQIPDEPPTVQATRGPSTTEQATRGQSPTEKATRGHSTTEQATRGQSPTEKATRGQSTKADDTKRDASDRVESPERKEKRRKAPKQLKRTTVYLPDNIDSKAKAYFDRFCDYVREALEEEIVATPMSGRSSRAVVLPCVVASRLGTDVSATFTKAQLPEGIHPILMLFHPRAHHNSEQGLRPPTRKLGYDFLEQTQFVVDTVQWEGKVYDCKQNYNEACELLDFLDK